MWGRYGWTLVIVLGLAWACALPEEVEMEGLENGSFSADLNGYEIYYEVHGQGPVVMTVPNSWGFSLEGLRAFYRPLEKRLTMVYFDPRGMGESSPIREEEDMGLAAVRADFQALRRHLGLETVHAIGWSNGATNLILLAAEQPERLSSAIFLHGAARFSEEDMKEWAQEHQEVMRLNADFQKKMADESLSAEEKTARHRTFWVEMLFPNMFANPEWGKAKLQEMYADVEFSWAHADFSNRETPPVFDARDKLPAITAKCLVIAGAHDMVATETVRELHDGLADSTFVVFEESGHFAPVEEPEKFEATLYEFLGVP
jgi:proline iminopeptidase